MGLWEVTWGAEPPLPVLSCELALSSRCDFYKYLCFISDKEALITPHNADCPKLLCICISPSFLKWPFSLPMPSVLMKN